MSDFVSGNGNSTIAGVQGERNGPSLCCVSRVRISPSELRFQFFTGEVNEPAFKRFICKVNREFFSIKFQLAELFSGHISSNFSEAKDFSELVKILKQLGAQVKKGDKAIAAKIPRVGEIFGIYFDPPNINRKRYYKEETGKENFKQVQL